MTFDDFWRSYPRRVAKLAARTAWDKAVRMATPDEIIAGARRYAVWLADGDGWKPLPAHPSTWLNQGRWMDELDSKPAFDAEAHKTKMLADRKAKEDALRFRESLLEQDRARRH